MKNFRVVRLHPAEDHDGELIAIVPEYIMALRQTVRSPPSTHVVLMGGLHYEVSGSRTAVEADIQAQMSAQPDVQ